ncbi:IS1 family transposase [Emticicia sp. BO119]|uniref:IS1 family transposase n=1 Tax=Emticicia sp. BO119 TaxID=2757768 RepID=UPI0015F09939|nr:IS1 family transposase [Emticicia sp. BO119]
MCLINIKVNCPHCHSTKVVKNGIKTTGRQNFLCNTCGKQFHRTADAVGISLSRSKSIGKISSKNRTAEAVLCFMVVAFETVIRYMA